MAIVNLLFTFLYEHNFNLLVFLLLQLYSKHLVAETPLLKSLIVWYEKLNLYLRMNIFGPLSNDIVEHWMRDTGVDLGKNLR